MQPQTGASCLLSEMAVPLNKGMVDDCESISAKAEQDEGVSPEMDY